MHENLLAEMNKLNLTKKDLAKKLKLTEKTLNKKISGEKPFRLNEAIEISKIILKKKSNIDYLFKRVKGKGEQ